MLGSPTAGWPRHRLETRRRPSIARPFVSLAATPPPRYTPSIDSKTISIPAWILGLASVGIACSGAPAQTEDPGDADGGPRDAGALSDGGLNDAGVLSDGGLGDAGVLVGDPFDAQALVGPLAAAICEYRAQCEPVYTDYLPETGAQCLERRRAELLRDWAAAEALIDAGRVAFVRSRYDACVDSHREALRDCVIGPAPGACAGLFRGVGLVGAACGATLECAAELYCPIAAPGACATCTRRPTAGEACEGRVCAAGTRCLMLGATARCTPDTAMEGAACGTAASGLCRGRLQCVQAPDGGVCARPAGPGETCATTGDAPDCDLFARSVCGADGRCAALTVVDPPAACGESQPTQLCNASARCDTATRQCVPLPGDGAACSALEPCLAGFHCASDRRCRARGAAGDPCGEDAACADALACVSARCAEPMPNVGCR